MYVELTNSTVTRIYFIAVYLTAVVVVMNVLTAFVLEAFISQYNKKEYDTSDITIDDNGDELINVNHDDNGDELNAEIENAMCNAIRMHQNYDKVGLYHYRRKLSKALFYEQLYPELFHNDNETEMRNNVNKHNSNSYNNTNQKNGHKRKNSDDALVTPVQ